MVRLQLTLNLNHSWNNKWSNHYNFLNILYTQPELYSMQQRMLHTSHVTCSLPGHNIFILWNQPKTSSFQLPYQLHSYCLLCRLCQSSSNPQKIRQAGHTMVWNGKKKSVWNMEWPRYGMEDLMEWNQTKYSIFHTCTFWHGVTEVGFSFSWTY